MGFVVYTSLTANIFRFTSPPPIWSYYFCIALVIPARLDCILHELRQSLFCFFFGQYGFLRQPLLRVPCFAFFFFPLYARISLLFLRFFFLRPSTRAVFPFAFFFLSVFCGPPSGQPSKRPLPLCVSFFRLANCVHLVLNHCMIALLTADIFDSSSGSTFL